MMTDPAPGRPAPSWEAPEGYEHVAVEDKDWRVASGKRCRYGLPSCQRPSVAELNRGRLVRGPELGQSRKVDSWWAYCDIPEHLFGRWIENGKVMHWILREKEAAMADIPKAAIDAARRACPFVNRDEARRILEVAVGYIEAHYQARTGCCLEPCDDDCEVAPVHCRWIHEPSWKPGWHGLADCPHSDRAHAPPKRDPASTTAAAMNLAPPKRPYNRFGTKEEPGEKHPFGFGLDVTA